MSSPTEEKPRKVTPLLWCLVAVFTASQVWLGIKSGEDSLATQHPDWSAEDRAHFVQGSVMGALALPLFVSLFSLIPRRRSLRRLLIVYVVAAAIFSVSTGFMMAFLASRR